MNALRIDHTAIVVRDLDEALFRYERLYGMRANHRQTVIDQGVEVAFLSAGDTSLELISPLTEESGVNRYLQRHGESLHHIAFLVSDITAELKNMEEAGIKVIDEKPRQGPHGLVAFVHPGATGGILIELVQRVNQEPIQA